MTFPSLSPDADPDPTTQLAWPTARPKRSQPQLEAEDREDESSQGHNSPSSSPDNPPGKRHLTVWDLITLSIAMGGAQIAWTVELG